MIAHSQEQLVTVRAAIVSYMVDIAHVLIGHHIELYTSVQEYVRANKMDR